VRTEERGGNGKGGEGKIGNGRREEESVSQLLKIFLYSL